MSHAVLEYTDNVKSKGTAARFGRHRRLRQGVSSMTHYRAEVDGRSVTASGSFQRSKLQQKAKSYSDYQNRGSSVGYTQVPERLMGIYVQYGCGLSSPLAWVNFDVAQRQAFT